MAKAQPMHNLWRGEYKYRDDRASAQVAFFEAIHRSAPEALEALRDNVLARIRGNVAGGMAVDRAIGRVDNDLLAWALEWRLVDSDDVFRWSFEYSWIRKAAWQILRHWHEHPKKATTLDYPSELHLRHEMYETVETPEEFVQRFLKPDPAPKPDDAGYHFHCRKWDLLQETRAKARARILAEVSSQLEVELDREEQRANEAGLTSGMKKIAQEHFDWLVLYQVKAWPYGRVAKVPGSRRDPQTVSDGVKDAAQLVIGPGWEQWLRPGRPGRPRKS
jgi:hypothetical protein